MLFASIIIKQFLFYVALICYISVDQPTSKMIDCINKIYYGTIPNYRGSNDIESSDITSVDNIIKNVLIPELINRFVDSR